MKLVEVDLSLNLALLDEFFKIEDLDLLGDRQYIRMQWTMLNDKYLEYCKNPSLEPVKYSTINFVR